MVPCPICGKNITKITGGITMPGFGSLRRQEFCAALDVPPFIFDKIQTRRKMCLSHFDEDQFHWRRHVLKESALPRKLTEEEKFVLFNSDFNRVQHRQKEQKNASTDFEETTPESGPSNLLQKPTPFANMNGVINVFKLPSDPRPSSSANNDVAGSSHVQQQVKSFSNAAIPNSQLVESIPFLHRGRGRPKGSINKSSNVQQEQQPVKSSLNGIPSTSSIKSIKLSPNTFNVNGGFKLRPSLQRNQPPQSLKKLFQAPVHRFKVPVTKLREFEVASGEFRKNYDLIKKFNSKTSKKSKDSARRLKNNKMPDGTVRLVNNEASTSQVNNDTEMLESLNDIKNVQSNSTADVHQIIKIESSEFSSAESDAKVLSSPSPNGFPSTSQAANNDNIFDVKTVVKIEPSEFSTSHMGNFSSPTVAELPSVSHPNLKIFDTNQISRVGAGKGTGNNSTINSILAPSIRYSRIYSLPLSDVPKRPKTMSDDSKLPIKFVTNQYKNCQKI